MYNIHLYDHAKLQVIYYEHFISSAARSHCIMFRFEAQSIRKGGAMKVQGVLVDAPIVWGKRFYILEFWGKIEKKPIYVT